MVYYVVDGQPVKICGRWWVDNARFVARVVPIAMCDGDAEGASDFTVWLSPDHAPVDDSRESDSKAI